MKAGSFVWRMMSWTLIGVTGGCGGGAGSPPVPQVTLSSIVVSVYPRASAPQGTSLYLTATGTYRDGHRKDLTAEVNWSSSSESVAAVSGSGVLSALANGQAILSAAAQGVAGTLTVTVTAAVPLLSLLAGAAR